MRLRLIVCVFVVKLFCLNWITSQVQVFAALQNVALNKDAHQRSTYGDAVAARAVDGNTNQFWDGGSCAHTEQETHPYWEVDLGDIYVIDLVRVYNRLDSCCSNETRDVRAEFSVDSNVYTTVCSASGQQPEISMCIPQGSNLGRWIRLSITDDTPKPLQLCEVEVMSSQKVLRELFKSLASVKGTGTILQKIPVSSDMRCAFYCSRNDACHGFNVVIEPTGTECHLLGSQDTTVTNDEDIAFWKLNELDTTQNDLFSSLDDEI